MSRVPNYGLLIVLRANLAQTLIDRARENDNVHVAVIGTGTTGHTWLSVRCPRNIAEAIEARIPGPPNGLLAGAWRPNGERVRGIHTAQQWQTIRTWLLANAPERWDAQGLPIVPTNLREAIKHQWSGEAIWDEPEEPQP